MQFPIRSFFLIPSCCSLLLVVPAFGQDNPRSVIVPDGFVMKTLKQNWSHEESNWFYNAPQGSRFMPYEWFLHLEQAENQKKFRDAENIRSFGYIPRKPDPENEHGLPIGFIKDATYPDGTAALGLTCAACHTGQIQHGNTVLLVDGAPTMGDFERFLRKLTESLEATASNDAKFKRFALAVLSKSSGQSRRELRAALRTVTRERLHYNKRNLPSKNAVPFGHGRVDAFGAIFNEVASTFLGIPGNEHPADAPVSYPCLWDTPQHDRVQWNGAAQNRTSPLGKTLFGTEDVGALGRNAGEVLGVFGSVDVNESELILPRRYHSTINKSNLINLEETISTLWSPKWPEDQFGKLDAAKVNAGESIYRKLCIDCHAVIDRTSETRKVKAVLESVGTDDRMVRNFGRMAKTGRLNGRRKTLLGVERFAAKEPIGVILKHVVERAILNPSLDAKAIAAALKKRKKMENRLDAIDSLNPGYRMTAIIETGKQQLRGRFDLLQVKEKALEIRGGRFNIYEQGRTTPNEKKLDLRSRALVKAAVGKLDKLVLESKQSARIDNAQAKIAYKARPLNGIWATAPYFHNGSVRTLKEVLLPPGKRSSSFHVGSVEFDIEGVGFKNDSDFPLFDATKPGNLNSGHDYSKGLNETDRENLLEYLKSL